MPQSFSGRAGTSGTPAHDYRNQLRRKETGMTDQTIQEAEAAYSEQAASLVRAWHSAQDQISLSPETVEGPHVDMLTDAQRFQASREQKAERASTEADHYRRQYTELQEERNNAVRDRARALRKELYAVENADVLTRAALATDDQLRSLMDLAATTRNPELASSVFVVAEQRGLDGVMSAYFQADPEAHALYEELQAAPTEGSMERRLADASVLFAPPTPVDYAPARARA